jgi:hypothetical protein
MAKQSVDQRLADRRGINFLRQEDTIAQLIKPGKFKELYKVIIEGGVGVIKGAKSSYTATFRSAKGLYTSGAMSILGDFKDILMSGKVDVEVIEASFLHRTGDMEKFKELPKQTQDAGIALSKLNDFILEGLQASGVNINRLDDYTIRQVHDATKVAKDKAGWKKILVEDGLLDLERTFGPDRGKADGILDEIWKDITSETYSTDGAQIVKKRVLHFNGGSALAKYNVAFGRDNLAQSILASINAAAKLEASHRTFGPDRAKFLAKFDSEIKRQIRKAHKGDKAKIASEIKRLDDGDILGTRHKKEGLFVQTFGDPEAGAPTMANKVSSSIGMTQSLAKLTGTIFQTPLDYILETANKMSITGDIAQPVKVFNNYMRNINKVNRQSVAGITHVMVDNELFGMFGKDTGNRFENMSRMGMELYGLGWTTRTNRSTSATGIAMDLAERTSQKWGELHPRVRGELSTFGIAAKEWEMLQGFVTEFKPQGIGRLFGSIPTLDMDRIYKELPRDTYFKIANVMNHNSWFGAIEAGPNSRSALYGKTTSDTKVGAAMRLLFQFKSFGVEAARKTREIISRDPNVRNTDLLKQFSSMSNVGLVAYVAAGSYTMAVMNMWLRDMAQGKTPRDMNQENVLKAMLQGPIPIEMHFMANLLTGQYGYGKSLLKDMAGVNFGQVDDMATAVSELYNGNTGASERLIRSNTPFVNHPLIRPAFQRHVLDGVNGIWNPDPLSKARSNAAATKRMREQGQVYFSGTSKFFDTRR